MFSHLQFEAFDYIFAAVIGAVLLVLIIYSFLGKLRDDATRWIIRGLALFAVLLMGFVLFLDGNGTYWESHITKELRDQHWTVVNLSGSFHSATVEPIGSPCVFTASLRKINGIHHVVVIDDQGKIVRILQPADLVALCAPETS